MIDVTAKIIANSDGGIDVVAELENVSDQQLYVFSGLWTIDSNSRMVAEQVQAYPMLEEKGTLQLLIGLAPLPRKKTVLFRNIPHAAALESGGRLAIRLAISSPVREHNPYFTEQPQFERVLVEQVMLVVDYLESWPELDVIPSAIFPDAFEIQSPDALSRVRRSTSSSYPVDLQVDRRTDEFDRI